MTDQSLAIIKKTLNSTEIMTRFASIMGEREAAYYINSVILAVANNKDLQECTPNSIVYSALRAASLKLSCDSALGEAYLIPFNNNKKGVKEAAFVPGYKGLRNLATRTNKYRYVNAGKLYNGQQWVEDPLTGKCEIKGRQIDHTYSGWFAFFEMFSGYSKGLCMTTEKIHEHAQQYSKTYSNPKSKWQSKDHLEVEAMEKKTVLRLLLVRWGDLGAAGNAFVDDEIIDGEFHDELTVIPDDETEQPKHTEAENMSALGFDAPVATETKSEQPTQVWDYTEGDAEPPIGENASLQPELPIEPDEHAAVPQDIVNPAQWPDELVAHLVTSNLGVKDPAKCVAMLHRSKIVTPTTLTKHVEMYINFYCQARKAGKDEETAANDADSKVANIIAANGK